VEESKLDKQAFSDFLVEYKSERGDKERRLRLIERWVWVGLGIVGFAEFAIAVYVGYFHHGS
jgi:hypothetical protein